MACERFFYEWAVMHVALMLTNANTMRSFRRYAQHFAFAEIPADARLLPQHAMKWQSYAEHWLESFSDIVVACVAEDYRGRLQPHRFSDSVMELHLLRGESAYERPDFRSGGVKVIHSLMKRPGEETADFDERWTKQHVPAVIDALKNRGLRKYVVDRQLGLDPATFKGTLFERGGVDQYAGVEELWFDSLEDALAMGSDPGLRDALRSSYETFADVALSHSMYVIERVVFDFVTPGESTPPPAILTPTSCEAKASTDDWMVFWPALGIHKQQA